LVKVCVSCGHEFEAERSDKMCCSRSCYRKHTYEKANPVFPVPCKGCGKTFIPDSHHMVFCGDECRKTFFNVKSKDDERFGGNRKKALIRDGHACTVCKSTHHIAVHHIDESGNSENVNNDLDNLITLCNSCHTKLHNPHRNRIHAITTTKCQACGIEFQITTDRLLDGRGKYCSKECKHASMSQPKTSFTANCLVCGKEFWTTAYKRSIGRGKYCSPECSQKAQTGTHKPKPITKQVIAQCKYCGKGFPTTQARIDDGRGRYCSRQCLNNDFKNMPSMKQKERKSLVNVNCQVCGKEFDAVISNVERGRAKYCSRSCYYKSRNKI